MAEFCKFLRPQDPSAFRLCEFLARRGEGLTSLDRGTFRLDFSDEKKPKQILIGARDGTVSAPEVRRRFLELTEAETQFPSGILAHYRVLDKTKVPWVFEEEKIFRFCMNRVRAMKSDLFRQGFSEESVAFHERLARSLFDFLRSPKQKGGLGLRYSDESTRLAQDLQGIYKAGKANCLEFVFLYLALARMAGIKAVPIEVFRDSKGNLVEHVRIGVKIEPKNPTRLFYLDLSNGLAAERSGELQVEISSSDLLAYYYNTVAVSSPVAKMGAPLKTALGFSPDQYMVLSNYGNWLIETGGSLDEALTVLLRAARSNPQFPFIWLGLEKIYTRRGDAEMARLAKQKAERLFQSRKPAE